MTFLLVHAFYKAGALPRGRHDREGRRRRATIRRSAGLARAMPLTATVVALAALSMAGLPPLFGFIGKELIYEATGHAPLWPAAVDRAPRSPPTR